jgi:hypothetical protein
LQKSVDKEPKEEYDFRIEGKGVFCESRGRLLFFCLSAHHPKYHIRKALMRACSGTELYEYGTEGGQEAKLLWPPSVRNARHSELGDQF